MHSSIADLIATYPADARQAFELLYSYIIEVAEQQQLGSIEQSLKWGQASFSCKTASPIRIAWQQKSADSISLFFNCNSKLVTTFREIYSEQDFPALHYHGNRQLSLSLSAATVLSAQTKTNEPLVSALKACISMALRYHRIKHLPLLGE